MALSSITICLDTDFLINSIKKDQKTQAKLDELEERGFTSLSTTVINAIELYIGAYRSKNKEQEIAKVASMIDRLHLLTLNHKSSQLVGEINYELRSNPIGEKDLLIAAIVKENDQILITRNTKHFEKVRDLKIESW